MEIFRAPEVFPERLESLALKKRCGLVVGFCAFRRGDRSYIVLSLI